MTPLPDQRRIAHERYLDETRGNGHLTQQWRARNSTPDDYAEFGHTGGRWHPVNRANVDRWRNRNMQPSPDGRPVDVNRSTQYTSLRGEKFIWDGSGTWKRQNTSSAANTTAPTTTTPAPPAQTPTAPTPPGQRPNYQRGRRRGLSALRLM